MLLRHGDAANHSPDHDRPLTEAGAAAALESGTQLGLLESPIDVILVSSAVRARQTADLVLSRIVQPTYGVSYERELYLADPATCVARLRKLPDAARSALVIGHNPGLSQLGGHWLQHSVSLHPAAWVMATFALRRWQGLS